jgi:glycosyltransferase involved in cell wall biosynthesis
VNLSVIVITKDEERVIGRCLGSVRWVDEIIVVDSGSTDRTLDICRELGARVSVTPDWPGFGPQKNRALALAKGDWVLSLDADEWLSDELADEMRAAVRGAADVAAYELPRLSSFCGRYMRHSGWWPDRVARLFRRGRARFSDDLVHERLIVDGTLGRLRGELLHETFPDLEKLLDKLNRYSSAGAAAHVGKGKRASLSRAVRHALWAFVRTYFLRAGFLDGREGFMLAVCNAEGVYYRYAKAWLLQRGGRGAGEPPAGR